ncbi:hypothetical protein [Roseovarius indicus]|uniref:Dihydrodipicolinate reductase n=1 Tax=Roseovarius indicus TaxID=540747 RepID=A0A0T5P1Q7_9RHOB|nr:hypothetical protein [Roseovarius indicus]KRS15012.1 hypothetical protein XM52_25910 [Roseovarius indicus]QEW25326.1 hypothetical protein RIdsm_01112 [Roseovarius indicus]SFE20825.1 4-hydroxy-tetrahydrodipicolinate reductase [Roseovarius indicus]
MALNCIFFGLGVVGQDAARGLLDYGVTISGAYSRTSHVGEDLGTVIGRAPIGVNVEPVTAFEARPGMADVAIFCTTNAFDELLGDAMACAEAGINVLSIAGNALYPWTFQPEVAERLDKAAKRGNATILGCGYQDGVMVHLTGTATSMTTDLTRIEMDCFSDFSRLGESSTERLGLGMAREAFPVEESVSAAADATRPASTMGQVLDALCDYIGLGRAELSYYLGPVVAEAVTPNPFTGDEIAPRHIIGMEEVVTATTPEGIELVGRLTAKLFAAGETEYYACRFGGAAPYELRLTPAYGLEWTTGCLVNRVADMPAAPAGLITVVDLPAPRFRGVAGPR